MSTSWSISWPLLRRDHKLRQASTCVCLKGLKGGGKGYKGLSRPHIKNTDELRWKRCVELSTRKAMVNLHAFVDFRPAASWNSPVLTVQGFLREPSLPLQASLLPVFPAATESPNFQSRPGLSGQQPLRLQDSLEEKTFIEPRKFPSGRREILSPMPSKKG